MKREKFAGRTSSVLRTLGVAAVVLASILVAGGFLAAQYGFFGGGTNAPSVPEDTMTRGLVGYWSMDEGTGSTAYDGSGDGNDGTIYGAQWTKGKNAGALQFDGTDDYVDCGNKPSLDIGTTDFTIEAWVNPSGDDWKTIISKQSRSYNNGDDGWVLGIQNAPNLRNLIWYDQARGVSGGSGISISNDIWTHIVVTKIYNDATIKFYKNGNFISSIGSPAADIDVAHNLWIGTNGYKNFLFNGTIDEVRIYNRALSAEEVRYHYNHGGPVAHWKFDEGSGTTIHDSSGNGHNGTLTP